MNFITDKQTISDLDILGKRGKASIYDIFNQTRTNGGAKLLEKMFSCPLSDLHEINYRSRIIKCFHSSNIAFPIESELLDAAEKYLDNTDTRSQLMNEDDNLGRKVRTIMKTDIESQMITNGISALIIIFHDLRIFMTRISELFSNTEFKEEMTGIYSIIDDLRWRAIYNRRPGKKIPFSDMVELDKLFRFTNREQVITLLERVYVIDVYMSVARIAALKNMTFAEAFVKGDNYLKLEGVYHPFLKHPVANTIIISKEKNVVFLTGANMAGKSTFMKAVGIAVYLAHMGFPVPVAKMEFSVCDGIFTTINLPDNLNSGFSHFYSEVLRVKKMAEQVKAGKNIFVIFDELFRGTNVKDAYEATVAITRALTQKPNCMFVMSTHLMEAGEVLKVDNTRINFLFLPTIMKEGNPVYTYRLEAGISADRHGMMIIQKENILNILKKDVVK